MLWRWRCNEALRLIAEAGKEAGRDINPDAVAPDEE
jgi:hypothetical protein